MSLRSKLLLVFVGLGVLPALAAGAWGNLAGTRAVGELLRGQAEGRAERIAHALGRALEEQRRRLADVAGSRPLGEFVAGARGAPEPAVSAGLQGPGMAATRAQLAALFESNRHCFESVSCFDASGRQLFRVAAGAGGVEFRAENLGAAGPPAEALAAGPARTLLAHSPEHGPSLLVTAPVAAAQGEGAAGTLVLEVRLRDLVAAADEGAAAPSSRDARPRHTVVALDLDSGLVAYHTNPALGHRPAADAMPHFEPVARRMRAEGAGAAEYSTPDGHRWLASFRRVGDLPLSLAVSEDYTASSGGVSRAGLWGLGLALAAGLAGVALMLVFMGRLARDLRRVTLGAEAVARGDLSPRVETEGMTAEARPLAEGFNRMTERLGAHLTTTSETKQFESFMRLSAILSHDLKNAVSGLSLLVSNMEKHIHREEFRQEAVESLRHATDKLRRLAARLTEPVKSLSGEYRRAGRPTDLVAAIRRVLAANVEPRAPLYELKTALPETLVATVEPDRIENVIENLVINGLEAMGAAGGRLTVEAGELEGGLVYFSVADTGVGMAPEFLRTRLYRPFATTKAKGIGLGLYTCREVVEAHGGRLEVESQLGVGTRFRVVLPSRLFTPGDPRTRPQKGAAAAAPREPGT